MAQRRRGLLIGGHTLISGEQAVIVISSRYMIMIPNPILISLQLAY